MPIYKVTVNVTRKEGDVKQTRLIDATNQATAIRFAGREWIEAEVCTISEAIELGAEGIKLEKADS